MRRLGQVRLYVLVLGSLFGCEYPFGWLPPFAYNQNIFLHFQNIFLHFKECIIESDYLELSPEKFCATRTGLVGNAVGEEDANACIRT